MLKLIGQMIICLAAGYCAVAAYSASHRAPRIEVSPIFHLGELNHDDEVHFAASFRNVGNATLRVEAPIAGCACLSTRLDANDVPPGGIGTFELTMRAAAAPGTPFQHEVIIPSNDPDQPRRTVLLEGRMRAKILASPAALNSDTLHPGVPWGQELVLRCSDPAESFEVTAVECDVPGLTIDGPHPFTDSAAPNSPAWLLVATTTPLAVGDLKGRIKVLTDHPKYSQCQIPVDLSVASRIQVVPSAVLLAATDEESACTVAVTFEGPFRLRDPINIANAPIRAEISEASNREWSVTFSRLKDVPVDSVQRGDVRFPVEGVEHESEIVIPWTVLPALAEDVDRERGSQ